MTMSWPAWVGVIAEDIDRSVDHARRAGFGNVSLDLIFGTPVETGDS